MDNPRDEKVAVVTEVREKLSAAEAAVLTEYRGLDVAAIGALRRALREVGGEYKIYKNTLVRFAARDLGLEIDELLTGPTAIAFVDGDAAAVAKALRDYARTNPTLVVKGEPVLLVDDLLATGGTALAGAELLRQAGARVERALFVIGLPELGGSAKLHSTGIEPWSLIEFEGH